MSLKPTEQNLQTLILVAYGLALSHMLWTGQVYRFVGGWMMPWLLVCCVAIWGLAIGSMVASRSTAAADGADGAGGGGGDEGAGGRRWQWAQGTLYALFVLPPVIYLAGLATGDLRWF